MDISKFIAKESCDVTLKDVVTGKDTDASIKLHGIYSDRFGPAFLALKKRNPSAEITDIDVEFLVDMTESWKGLTSKKKALRFTRKRALELYTASKPIRSQLVSSILQVNAFLTQP